MRHIDQVAAMAAQAAALLPESPADTDVLGYLAWKELVWSTATRLGRIAGDELGDIAAVHGAPADDAPVTGTHLLQLAAMARNTWSSSAVEHAPVHEVAPAIPACAGRRQAQHALGVRAPRHGRQ